MAQRSRARLGGDYRSLHRQNQMLAKQVDQLSMLREIGLVINRSLELAQTLPDIANVVQGALEVRRLTIYELDEKQNRLRPIIAKYGDDLITAERLEEDSMPFRGTPFEEAVRSGAVLLVAEPHRRAAFVPLMAEYNALGVLLLEDPRDGEPFDPEDRAFFHQLGAQIALAIHNAKLYAMAVTDGLTGLYVRRYFDLRMEEEFDQARRYRRCFSLLMFDIDHFKQVNDTYGHVVGDRVLKNITNSIRQGIREGDILLRYGGEEFMVILPGASKNDAFTIAERVRHIVRESKTTFGENQISVTISVGLDSMPETTISDEQELITNADEALYRSKNSGRDKVTIH